MSSHIPVQTFISLIFPVVFKVLALYDSTAVVYWCRNPGSDGVCRPESLTLEILARSPDTDIPDSTLRAMQQCSVSACVNLPDLLPTSQGGNISGWILM